MKTKVHICYIHVRGLGPAHICSLVRSSVFGSPQGSRLVDSVGLPVELYPFRALSLSHDSFIRFPKLHLVFGSGSLHLFQSAAGRSLSEDSHAGLRGQLCLQAQQSIMSSVRDWCLPMGWVSSWVHYWLDILSISAPSCPCISYRQDKFWVKSIVDGLVSLSLHWGACLATGGGFFRFSPVAHVG